MSTLLKHLDALLFPHTQPHNPMAWFEELELSVNYDIVDETVNYSRS